MAAGVRALHEAKGRDGQVSCYLTVDDWWNPYLQSGGKRSDYMNPLLIHIIRHPLTCISSLVAFNHPQFWHWQQGHTDIVYRPDSLSFAAKFWLRWHEIIERQNPDARFRVEHGESDWRGIAYLLGDENKPLPVVERDPSWETPNKKPIVWDDLGSMTERVRAVALHYGYTT
jgi:hypothetical protein